MTLTVTDADEVDEGMPIRALEYAAREVRELFDAEMALAGVVDPGTLADYCFGFGILGPGEIGTRRIVGRAHLEWREVY